MRGAKFLTLNVWVVRILAVVAMLGALAACGSKAKSDTTASTGDGATSSDDSTVSDDVPTGDLPGHDAIAVDTSKVESKDFSPIINVFDQGQQMQSGVRALVIHPLDCTVAAPCPLVIVVGDYDTPAFPTFNDPAKKLAAVAHVNIVLLNPPGTGDGAQHSSGTNDFGGVWHTTIVKEVFKLQSVAAGVDKTKVGFLTIGTGIVPVAGAFYAFPSDLAPAFFVIDVEGPADRCAMSQAPEDDKKNIGPSDGAGSTDSACHFSVAPHSAQYPPAQNGKPASIVCAPGAWPITETGKGCDSDGNAWWVDREPYGKLQKVTARYQRLQFKYDHRLPSHWSSRLAMKAMANSPSNFFMLNDMPGANGTPGCGTVNDDDCAALEAGGQSCWLSGDYGNGLLPAPYAGADFRPISWDALFSEVLPDYVSRVLDTKGFPKCK